MDQVNPAYINPLPSVGIGAEPQGADSEADLWAAFAEASSGEIFIASWLALQCRVIRGILGGLVLLGTPDQGRYLPAAVWPERRSMKHVTATAERALTEHRGVLFRREADGQAGSRVKERYEIAYPLEVDRRLHGVVVLEVLPRPEAQLQAVMRQLHWGAAWLEVLLRRQQAAKDAAVRERLQTVLDLLATVLEHGRFYEAATAFVTDLATRLDCDRVSIGFVKGGRARVRAVSHSAQFGKETNLTRSIESAMDEAVDQQTVIVFPRISEGSAQVVRCHAELARQHGAGAILTIPLSSGRVLGALTLERPADRPFDPPIVEVCEAVAAAAGPLLELKRREDRWPVTKLAEACWKQVGNLIGPRHVALKLAVAAAAGVILFFTFATGDYRITARTVIEPVVRRAAVAPFSGYIREAPVRAGDLVREGQLLAALDDRELRIERLKWFSQEQQFAREYQRALGERNAAQIVIFRAQIDQAKAQLKLIDDQLSRTRVLSPVDGVIVTGDLSQELGAPVERGGVLFEVAPLEAYRVILEVDDRDIADVTSGQTGYLVVSAFPNERLPFTIEKITPVSTAREGRNYFRVEAQFPKTPERLRPGMEGISKIEVDRRRLLWIWTHELVNWIRLKLWSWQP